MGGSMSGGGLLDGYLNARDMIDGGGAGRSGSEFQGGGLLSAIANAIGKPLGSRDRQQRQPMPQPMPRQQFQPQPVAVSTGGPRPMAAPPVSQPEPQAPMQYGPPARALVGPQLRNAMDPQRAAPVVRPVQDPSELLRKFEEQLIQTPGGVDVIKQLRGDGDMAERLLLDWIRNGYQIPGA